MGDDVMVSVTLTASQMALLIGLLNRCPLDGLTFGELGALGELAGRLNDAAAALARDGTPMAEVGAPEPDDE